VSKTEIKIEKKIENKKDTKLIAFLKTFTKPELSEFEKFLKSPYFKKERDPLPLFNFLKKHYPGFPPEKISDENIITELYPGENTSDKKYRDLVRNYSSALLKSVTDYIFYSNLKNDTPLKNRTILKGLLDRNLIKYYEQFLTDSYKDISTMNQESVSMSMEFFQLEQLNTRYFSYTLEYGKFLDHAQKSLEWISAHFILNLIWTSKIKYLEETYNSTISESNFTGKLFESIDMEKALEAFTDHQKYPEILFNYYTYKSIINNNDLEYYRKAKEIFITHRARISIFEKNFFYADMINILSSGHEIDIEYKRIELFEIMSYCVEDKAYKVSDNDFMHPSFYRSAVIHSIAVKKFDWAEEFIENYTGELQPEFMDNMRFYSIAVVKFARKDFEKSLEYISKVKYDFTRLKADVKFLMLKIYYELNLEDPAYFLIDTFKHYASDSKEISEDTRKSVKTFLMFYSKLLKMRINSDFSECRLLRKQIENDFYVYHRDWLIEKINELDLKN
jgi:hypothetical protein